MIRDPLLGPFEYRISGKVSFKGVSDYFFDVFLGPCKTLCVPSPRAACAFLNLSPLLQSQGEEGSKGGRKEGMKERRKEVRMVGRKDGREEQT